MNKKIRTDHSGRFPQRGMIVCAACGGHMTASISRGNGGEFGYYWCQNRKCAMHRKLARQKDVEGGFARLLQKTHLKPEAEKIVVAVFDRVWGEEAGALTSQAAEVGRRRDALKAKVKQFAEAAVNAKSEQLRAAYEGEMEDAAEELKGLEGPQGGRSADASVPYQTALAKATGLLKNPGVAWVKLDPKEQQELFYFVFERKLAYDLKTGYQTGETPSVARLFDEFVVENTKSVDRSGFEPLTSALSR